MCSTQHTTMFTVLTMNPYERLIVIVFIKAGDLAHFIVAQYNRRQE